MFTVYTHIAQHLDSKLNVALYVIYHTPITLSIYESYISDVFPNKL